MRQFKAGDTIEAIKDYPQYNILVGQYYIVRQLKDSKDVYFNGNGKEGQGMMAIEGKTCKAIRPLFYTEGLDNDI